VLYSIFLSDWNERFPTTTKTALHVRCGFGNNFEKSDIMLNDEGALEIAHEICD